MNDTVVYQKTLDAASIAGRFVSSCGGTRSGKTFAALEWLYKRAARDKAPSINSVVSETFPHLKRGAIRDFQTLLGDRWDESCWSKGESVYTLPNGSIIEFFSADSPAKVHGPARDRLFLNEVQNIPYEIARQLFVRTRGLIIMDYNPTHSFWANELIETRPECVTIHSTYKDNPFLTPEQVAEIESNRHDRNWWQVYGEGKVGTLEGLIYTFEQIDRMPEPEGLKEVWGMDFGFTNDPTAIVRCLVDTGRKTVYVDEKCYRTRMMNADIAALLKAEGIGPATEIYADCAEPKSIAEIRTAGLKVLPSDKDAPVRSQKLTFQLQWMQGWQIRVTKSSVNLIKELRNYTWDKDKDGNSVNYPIDTFNHCFVAGTMIATPDGERPIETIRPGDYVITSEGPKVVENFFNNGCRPILDLTLVFSNFEVSIKATPDHKFKTSKGWKQLKNLKPGDVLYVLNNSTAKLTTSTTGNGIIPGEQNDCTVLSGNTTTAQSQRGTKYTTKTGIRRTTTFPTLSVFLLQRMKNCTVKKNPVGRQAQKRLHTSIKLLKKQRNGIGPQKVVNGIKTMQGKDSRNYPSDGRLANAAERNLNISRLIYQDSVQTPVNPVGVGKSGQTMKPVSVSAAEKNLRQTTIPTPSLVQKVVLQSIGGNGSRTEQVFDLCVADCHEYFANGILVHNCLDALRYAVWSKFGKRGTGSYNISIT